MKTTRFVHAVAMRFFAISLMLLSVLHPFFVKGQCLSVTANPDSAIQDASGVLSFDSPDNIKSSNSVYAKAKATLTLLSGTTNQLKAMRFGFSIPSYSMICGVTVNIKRDAAGIGVLAWIADNDLHLLKSGTPVGNNMKQGGTWSGSDVTISYGSTNVLTDWNTTLTPADVNDPNFGLSFSAAYVGVVGLLPSINVDNISMTVYYNPLLPTHLLSFDAGLWGQKAHLEWATADEEDGEIIVVQRSDGTSSWEDIASFSMRRGNTGARYVYDDPLPGKGNFAYRLRILNNNGVETFSAIRTVRYGGKVSANAYPNPASRMITVQHELLQSPVQVYNIFQQQLKVPVLSQNGRTTTLDINTLTPGIYFVVAGTERVSFVKQ